MRVLQRKLKNIVRPFYFFRNCTYIIFIDINYFSIYITAAVRSNDITRKAEQYAIETQVSKYLYGANDREGGRKKRSQIVSQCLLFIFLYICFEFLSLPVCCAPHLFIVLTFVYFICIVSLCVLVVSSIYNVMFILYRFKDLNVKTANVL